MLEFYQAYANYHDLMELTEEIVKFVAMEVNGTTVAPSESFNDAVEPLPRLDRFGRPSTWPSGDVSRCVRRLLSSGQLVLRASGEKQDGWKNIEAFRFDVEAS